MCYMKYYVIVKKNLFIRIHTIAQGCPFQCKPVVGNIELATEGLYILLLGELRRNENS